MGQHGMPDLSVAVVVPWRPGCPHREASWSWIRGRYERDGWPIVEGVAPAGPWRKAAAVNPAVATADADVIVVADADVWCDGLSKAVDAVLDGAVWAIPHRKVHRLTELASEAVRQGAVLERADLEQAPYRGVEGGGLVVARRAALLDVPLDPRFVGWGGEDHSWGYALRTLLGRAWRGTSPLWHLWHPAQPRLSRRIGSEESEALHLRYAVARRNPAAMRALVEEVTGCRT